MTIQFSTAVRNAMLDNIESTIGTSAKLQIYSGSAPANCGTAASGTKLVEYALASDWWAAAGSGAKALNNLPLSSTGLANGTAGYFRIVDSAGTTCHMQGTVGTSGTDMTIDNTSINTGQTANVTGWTLTAPGA